MDITDIKKMTFIERLQAMELLWDSLLHEDHEIDSPDWHEEILHERKYKIRNGKSAAIPLDKVRKALTR